MDVYQLPGNETTSNIMEELWSLPRPFFQDLWLKIFSAFGNDEWIFGFYGMWLFSTGGFWIMCAPFFLLDLTGKPKFLTKYRLQSFEGAPVSFANFFKAAKVALYNQIVVGAPMSAVAYHLFKWRGVEFTQELPHFNRFILDLIIMLAVEEAGFYYFHRMLHHPRMYKHIHKIHHEFTSPFSIAAIYCHPFEQFLANVLPPVLGAVIVGAHPLVFIVWILGIIGGAIHGHCGYAFPWYSSPVVHDYHHDKFEGNYGAVLGILDRIHGTRRYYPTKKVD